ncbi:molecular chaperone [Shewanella sp. 4_MG-2023]|uniref:TorD/DmsD family molecular chaperone n=1 Tax=Shewanella sp. 4_MG-2023 TaxID=3062652 RepID=UPI0026E2914F|nr:molecular chaperone TorD family protein [Shewanella sp. 4_MG-2023]MDO6678915.1 molecular chaperone TorD family protein [Shewanella sp. 4_MG-2023]
MNNDEYVKNMAGMFNFLAEVFYQKPTDELKETISTLELPLFITKENNIDNHFRDKLEALKKLSQTLVLDDIKQDYNALFIRPKGKLAYPWGSVYLSNNNRLFDQSTLLFMDFCKKNHLNFNLPQHQPMDHFGLMLVALVYCLELDLQDGQQRVKELLEQHLLSWSDRFLSLVIEHSTSHFYGVSAQLCQLLLTELTLSKELELKPVTLYK